VADDVLVKPVGRGLHLTLNDPKGVSDAAALELTKLLLNAHERAAYVVLRSSGGDFITGRNNPRPPAGTPPAGALERRRFSEVIFDLYGSFRTCPVPIVGVVNGRAMGLGCSVAALCDITFAADSATFQINEMNHRILPTMVMSSLVDRVARKDLMYLVLSRATVSAERARAMKIVTEVVAADRLDAAVADLIAIFEQTPSIAMASVKEYLNAAYDMPIKGAVDFARNLHATINAAPEMQAEPVV
jgi:enoyl-CoA hydratase/carnithine racemase